MYRADTLVVKLAQSFAYKSLVVPVMSSHWAGAVPPAQGGRGHTEVTRFKKRPRSLQVSHRCTYDGAQQTQAGGVALPRVPRALSPRGGQGDTQPDGSVELAPPRLHGDHGAKVCLVAQQLCNQLVRNWLSLRFKTAGVMGSAHTGTGWCGCMNTADVWD